MALDFREIRNQVNQLGEKAPGRAQKIKTLYDLAFDLLNGEPQEIERLRRTTARVVQSHDPSLRCAIPVSDELTASFPTPARPEKGTIIAVDGSQISPDRHAQVYYGLINLGAVQMQLGDNQAPRIEVESRLLHDEQLYTRTGIISDERFSLKRDLGERVWLSELARKADPPVIALTDGPVELWGARQGEGSSEFSESLKAYLEALAILESQGVTTCGYVDNPAANLAVRFLEMGLIPEDELSGVRGRFPLRGVFDRELFKRVLGKGERSIVFAIQSRGSREYSGNLALHFFYLNVGVGRNDWIVRVETPAWVVDDEGKLNYLHALLVHQCRLLGNRPYPYILHRAHESALVSMAEKEQVSNMIINELHSRGIKVGGESPKPTLKRL
jgi:hypothetical protein